MEARAQASPTPARASPLPARASPTPARASPTPARAQPSPTPDGSSDSFKKTAKERWQKAERKAKIVKLANLAKDKEKDQDKEAPSNAEKGEKDKYKKKVSMFHGSDTEKPEGEEDGQDNTNFKNKAWRRVSLWAKVGFPASVAITSAEEHNTEGDDEKSKKAICTAGDLDSIAAVQKVRLWRETEERSQECSKFRFRAKLARRMVYSLAQQFIEDKHWGRGLDKDVQRPGIKDVFHAVLVGVRQVLLMSRVADVWMALSAEMQIREDLTAVSWQLNQTHDLEKFKEALKQVKDKMHEALDTYRGALDVVAPQEQISLVENIVQMQESAQRKCSQTYLQILMVCQAQTAEEAKQMMHNEDAEKLWKRLMTTRHAVQHTQGDAMQLQEALYMLNQGEDDEGSEDGEELAELQHSVFSDISAHDKERLIKILEQRGSEAVALCQNELKALGLSEQQIAQTQAAISRLAWKRRAKEAAALAKTTNSEKSLNDQQSANTASTDNSLNEHKSEMGGTDLAALESTQRIFPGDQCDRSTIRLKLRKSFAPSKEDLPSHYRKMSAVDYSLSRRQSRHAFAIGYLQRAQLKHAYGSAEERNSRSSQIIGEERISEISNRLSLAGTSPRHRFSLVRGANEDDSDSDNSEDSDEKDSDNEEDPGSEAYEPQANARVDIPGFQISDRPSRKLIESAEESETTAVLESEKATASDPAHQSDETDKRKASELPISEAADGGDSCIEAEVVELGAKAASVTLRGYNIHHRLECSKLVSDSLEPVSKKPKLDDVLDMLDPLTELQQMVISIFQGIDEAAQDLACCGGDVGGSGMISLATLHKRLEEKGYKRGLAEVCTLFRALGLTFCSEGTTITQEQFRRLGDIHRFHNQVQEDAQATADLRRLFKSVVMCRGLMNTLSDHEYSLSAVAIALSKCKDAAVVAGLVDPDALQMLLDSLDRCFESLHGQHGQQFAASVVSKWGLRILMDVIACSDVSKEIRVASVILISESLAQHGYAPCSHLDEDFTGKPAVTHTIVHLSDNFFMQELWRPLLNSIDPEGPGPPQPVDPQLLEQVLLLLLQVHMPSWILPAGPHFGKLAAEVSLALRQLHACPLEAKALLRSLHTFHIFDEDQEAPHTANQWHTLAAALGGCRLLREQLALLHAHEEADVELKGHFASVAFAREGDHLLRLWRAARERLFTRWPCLRQTPPAMQKLRALVQVVRLATAQGFQTPGAICQRPAVEIEKEAAPPTDKNDSVFQPSDQEDDMGPIFLTGSVESEAVLRLEQRWKLGQLEEQQRLVSYDFSRPSIPPLAQATQKSQAYLMRNGVMNLPMLPPRSSQGKRWKKKQDSGQQKFDGGVHVLMPLSGSPLLCKTSRVPSRSTPRAGRSLQPLPESQVHTPRPWDEVHTHRAWDEFAAQSTRRVQTASGGFRSREMPWKIQDEPRERSRPCTTGRLGGDEMAGSRAAWQVQHGSAWRSMLHGRLPALDHFP